MNVLPQFSPTFHVRSATIAAHRGQLEGWVSVQKRQQLAERMGFEPTIRFPLYALSRGDLRFFQGLQRNGFRELRGAFPQFSPDFQIFTTCGRTS